MAKRATIKDIAVQANVSIGTVHCALAGKTGVGDATRQRILDIAKQNNYRPNTAAASLKRKAVTIAAAFPEPVGENRFYYPFIWQGIRDCLTSQSDFNLRLLEMPYQKGFGTRENEILGLFAAGRLHGLVTVGFLDDFGQASLNRFTQENIPVALVGDDMPGSARLCSVMPNYRIIGRILGELIARQLPRDGETLICAGNADIPSHYLIRQGFAEYMAEAGVDNPAFLLHADPANNDAEYDRIVEALRSRPGVAACFSVNARGSVLLGRALRDTGRAGEVFAVGSDLFSENCEFLRDGVFSNLLHKNPYHQAHKAAQLLISHLLRDERPESDVTYISSEVVFRSALPMYGAGFLSPPAFTPASAQDENTVPVHR